MAIAPFDALVAVSVSIPGDSASHNVLALVRAASTVANAVANPSATGFQIVFQNDPDQASGTKSIVIGNSFVSATNGIKIPYGQSLEINNQKNENSSLGQFWVVATGTSAITMNVLAVRG